MRSLALALAVAVAVAGCTFHGGATIGIRAHGKITYGWQGGLGTFGELLVGQTFADGRSILFAALHGWYPARIDHDEPDDHIPHVGRMESHLGLMVGVASDGRATSLAAGFDARQFITGEDDASSLRGIAFTAGFRVLGGEAELYLAAEGMLIAYPTGD